MRAGFTEVQNDPATMKTQLLTLLWFHCLLHPTTALLPHSPFKGPTTSPRMLTSASSLAQHAPEAVTLFNNMKTPASIIAGILVPLGFIDPVPMNNDEVEEGRLRRALRHSYQVVAMMSLMSTLISVMWATVAVNQLTETSVAPAESVWHLLRRDFDLPWMGTNAHFVGGMLGLAYLLACRTFFRYDGGRMGTSLAGLAYSGLLLMVSIVNRGVSSGSGDGMRYGRHIGGLFATYGMKLTHKAMTKSSFGPLGVASLLMGAASLLNILLNIGGKSFKNTDNRKGGNMDVL